ncbi:MAG: GNAT family N-acetyltransferase [candidate division Zixibacteria bacterium]|nr:GNAT family N-acetyltransferase [candidate division Zixibacteria bacterium]
MDFQIVKTESLNLKAWSNLSQDASFFHTVEWCKICAKAMRAEAVFLCLFSDDILLVGMPGIITSKLKIKSFYSMPFGTYGGILTSPDVSDKEMSAFNSELSNYFTKEKYSRIVIADFDNSVTGTATNNFIRKKHFTQVLTYPVGEYRPGKKTLTEIRVGEKNGGEIVTFNDGNYIDEYFSLYEATEKRHGRKKSLYGKQFFKILADSLLPSKKLYWNGLVKDGQLIGSQIHFLHGRRQYYWQAVSHPDKRDFRPDYRLLYDAIQYGVVQGIREINLGASPEDAEGLIFFKKRWGSVKKPYDILEYKSKLYSLLRKS